MSYVWTIIHMYAPISGTNNNRSNIYQFENVQKYNS